MVRIGMFLGDRYEILEKIGSGTAWLRFSRVKGTTSMKPVFVAVKRLLKENLWKIKNFVRKFRRRPRPAAGAGPPEYRQCL